MTFTAAHCRAARSALGWSIRDLAIEAGLAYNTVSAFENGHDVREATSTAIECAIRSTGMQITATGIDFAEVAFTTQR